MSDVLLPSILEGYPAALESARLGADQPDPVWLALGVNKAVEALAIHPWRKHSADLAIELMEEWHAPVNVNADGKAVRVSWALNKILGLAASTPSEDALLSIERVAFKLIEKGACLVSAPSATVPSSLAVVAQSSPVSDGLVRELLRLVQPNIMQSGFTMVKFARHLAHNRRSSELICGCISAWTVNREGLQQFSELVASYPSDDAPLLLSMVRELELGNTAFAEPANASQAKARL